MLSFFSLDSRDKYVEDAQHWSNEQILGGRGFFRLSSDPPSLIIENVREADAGLYRCRLDFKHSPTLYRNVNLPVITKFIVLPVFYLLLLSS